MPGKLLNLEGPHCLYDLFPVPLDSQLQAVIHGYRVLVLYHRQTRDAVGCSDSNGRLVLTVVLTGQSALTQTSFYNKHTRGLGDAESGGGLKCEKVRDVRHGLY